MIKLFSQKNKIKFLAISLFFLFPLFAFGAGINNVNDIITKVEQIADWMLRIALAVSVIMIVWGGFQFLTSGGDEAKVTNGRKTILWAAVGIAVVLLADAIKIVIANFVK